MALWGLGGMSGAERKLPIPGIADKSASPAYTCIIWGKSQLFELL